MKARSLVMMVLALGAFGLTSCTEDPPPVEPPTTRHHVTTWVGDAEYADTLPEVDHWVGYGFAFYQDMAAGGCGAYEVEHTTTYERLNPATLRMTVVYDWTEEPNEWGNYGCLPNDSLNLGLEDSAGVEHGFAVLDRVSHT